MGKLDTKGAWAYNYAFSIEFAYFRKYEDACAYAGYLLAKSPEKLALVIHSSMTSSIKFALTNPTKCHFYIKNLFTLPYLQKKVNK